jgi:hypothetical protein
VINFVNREFFMACCTCPVARYLSLGVLVVGVVAISAGLVVSNQRSAAELPAPAARVTPVAKDATPTGSEELNPTINTRDWQMVNTPVRGKR